MANTLENQKKIELENQIKEIEAQRTSMEKELEELKRQQDILEQQARDLEEKRLEKKKLEEKKAMERKQYEERQRMEKKGLGAKTESMLTKTAVAAATIDAINRKKEEESKNKEETKEQKDIDKNNVKKINDKEKIHDDLKQEPPKNKEINTMQQKEQMKKKPIQREDKAYVLKQNVTYYYPYEKNNREHSEDKILAICKDKNELNKACKECGERESAYGDREQKVLNGFKVKPVPIYNGPQLENAYEKGEDPDKVYRNVVYKEKTGIDPETGKPFTNRAVLGISAGITQEEADFVASKMISYFKEDRTIGEIGDDNADPSLDARETFRDIQEAKLDEIREMHLREDMERHFQDEFEQYEDAPVRSLDE